MATPFADIRTAAGNNMDRSVQWYVRAVRQYARGVNTFQEAQGTDLGKEARNIDLEIFSTPFDEYGVDFLMDLGVSAFKIASPEINHIPLIRKICETGKPIILSSGVADLKDITLAIDTIRNNQPNADIILMQCNSSYPSPYEDLNLLTIKD